MITIAGLTLPQLAGIVLLTIGALGYAIPNLSKLKTLLPNKPQPPAVESDYATEIATLCGNSDVALFAIVNKLSVEQTKNLVTFLERHTPK